MLVLREKDHTLLLQTPQAYPFLRLYLFNSILETKPLPIFHFERIFLIVKSQTGQEGLLWQFHVADVFK